MDKITLYVSSIEKKASLLKNKAADDIFKKLSNKALGQKTLTRGVMDESLQKLKQKGMQKMRPNL